SRRAGRAFRGQARPLALQTGAICAESPIVEEPTMKHTWLLPVGLLVLVVSCSALVLRDRLAAQENAPTKGIKDKTAALTAKEERQLLLQTVGLLSASQVYQAYLNIGLVADGKAAKLYQAEDAQQLLEPIFKLLDATDRQLEKVG